MTEATVWIDSIPSEPLGQAIAPIFIDEANQLTPLEQLNLDVAAIAGWENIEEWNPNPKTSKVKKVFQGTNKRCPELGIFVPDYTSDLNAIFAALKFLDLNCCVSTRCSAWTNSDTTAYGETPAIALCKLLIELAPTLSKPEPEKLLNAYDIRVVGDYVATLKYESEVQIVDDDGDIDEPTVIKAVFE